MVVLWFGGNFLIVIPLQVRRLCFAMPRFVAILRLMFGQDRLYKYLLQYVKTCDLICLYIVFKNNNNIDSLSGCGFATVTVIAVVISLLALSSKLRNKVFLDITCSKASLTS